jgi:hypothetical protein
MMKEDNSPSFVLILSCQLLAYSWSAPYDEDSYIRVIRSDADEAMYGLAMARTTS